MSLAESVLKKVPQYTRNRRHFSSVRQHGHLRKWSNLGRPRAMLSFAHFQTYFDAFSPYLFEAYMHNWGESLLNQQVYSMIDYAQKHDVATNLRSNFVKLDSHDLDNIIDSGLEYLIVSL